jgi:16S rRNA C1402 (ribose-2'-O) methylase RsmI
MQHVAEREPQGEYVIVLEGAPARIEPTDDDIRSGVERELANGASKKTAVSTVADHLGVAKNRVYDLALSVTAPPRPPG